MAAIKIMGGTYPKQTTYYTGGKLLIAGQDKKIRTLTARAVIKDIEKVSEDKKSITFKLTFNDDSHFVGNTSRKIFDQLVADHATGPQDGDQIQDIKALPEQKKEPPAFMKDDHPAKKLFDLGKTVTAWGFGTMFVLLSFIFLAITYPFLAVFSFVVGLITVPPVSRRLPRIPVMKKVIFIAVLFITFMMVDGHFHDKARRKQATVIAQKAEEERLEKVAAFSPVRDKTISEIEDFIAKKEYEQARDLAGQYRNLKDPKVNELYDTAVGRIREEQQKKEHERKSAEFKKNRSRIITDIKAAMDRQDYITARNIAADYLGVADKEVVKLYEQADKKRQEQAKEQQVRQAAQSMNVESEKAAVIVNCQTMVKNSLKAPRTAKFPFTTDVSVSADKMIFTINSYVDAQNGFGALIRTRYLCRMKYNGGGQYGWTLEDFKVNE